MITIKRKFQKTFEKVLKGNAKLKYSFQEKSYKVDFFIGMSIDINGIMISSTTPLVRGS